MKKVFTLLTLLVAMTTSAWGDDYVSAKQTFTTKTVSRDSCEWSELKAVVTKNTSVSGDGLYFTAGGKSISNTSGAFGSSAWIIYLQVPSASSNGYVTMVSNSDAADRPLYLNTYKSDTNPGAKLVCQKKGSRIAFTADDVVKIGDNYYLQLSNSDSKDVKIKTIGILLNGESYPETVAVDPVFSLSKTSISTAGTAQIAVGTKADLDGITLSDITYGTAGIVTVDAETGVVTPAAVGTTTINFSSNAVAGKYNASTGNSLTITVKKSVTVFDAAGLYNQEILLSQANVEDNDYLTCNAANWTDRGWTSPYDGNFLDMKTDRKITFKVKNADAFELYVNGTSGRTYTIKVGDADAVEYTQGDGSFVSSGIIETGTTDEVTIEIEGGSSSLYPVYFNVNPAATITPAKEYTTLTSAMPLDFTGSSIEAYIVKDDDASDGVITLTQVNKVPANTGLVLKASEVGTAVNVPFLTGDADDVTGNKMTGSATEKTEIAANGGYILKDGKFHPANAGSLAKGKAYLKIAVSAAAPVMSFDSEGSSTTAIDTIEKSTIKNGVYYNLAGQRVAQPTKGLYIVNGKKVIVK